MDRGIPGATVHGVPAWQPTPVFLTEKSHGQGNPGGYSPWGPKESETTKHNKNSCRMRDDPCSALGKPGLQA